MACNLVPKNKKVMLLTGLGILISCFFIILLWNNSDGVKTYEEYLKAIEEPYRGLYIKLQALPDHPTEEEVIQIYHKFDIEIRKLKISKNAEKLVIENYRQLSSLPQVLREEYNSSSYKYSTLIGQASNVKLMIDHIEKEKE